MDDAISEIIKNADVDGVNALKTVDGHAVSGTQLEEKLPRIDLDRLVGVLESAPQSIFNPAPKP